MLSLGNPPLPAARLDASTTVASENRATPIAATPSSRRDRSPTVVSAAPTSSSWRPALGERLLGGSLPAAEDTIAGRGPGAFGVMLAGAGGAGDSEIVGQGPNGEALYNAEWAREPTDAELGGYLPKNAPDGAGLIMCKTIPENRVDDCIELGNDPPGSHLASAVRQAAWQFRVRPPRKNGVPMIGAWVRIRIDYETTRAN